MRALIAGERTTIAGARVGHLPKVEITNGSGTWKDYTAYLLSVQWSETIDQPVSTGTLRFRRAALLASLAPLMAASTLNVDDAAAYAPAIDLGRLIRINTATHTIGGALTYREVFTGRVDAVEWANDPIDVSFSDLGAWLMDTQIETERAYGSSTGTLAETVLQSIVTDNPDGGPAVTVYTPVSPAWNLHAITQSRVKVLEALRALAVDGIGWDVRYRYDVLHSSRLTFYDPQRSRVTVDDTIPPSEYTDVRRLSLALADVRNAGSVVWFDTTGAQQRTPSTDAGSISKYRRRYFELTAPDAIDTSPEASTLADSIVHDLSGAPAEQEVVMPYFWPVQIYDRYTFTANGVHYDSDQTLTVVGFTHAFENGQGVTTLVCTGRVVGAYAAWLKKITNAVDSANEIRDLTRTDSADGDTSTFSFTIGAGTATVWASAVDITAPQQTSDWDLVDAALSPLGAGVLTFTVTRPIDGHEVLGKLVPYDAAGNPGTFRPFEIAATPQLPHVELDDIETTTLGTQWWKITERGIHVLSVEVQTQIGVAPISAWGPPTRSAGAASLVRGGLLGAGEYEHDVLLDVARQSWIMPRLNLDSALPPKVLGPFGFDRDKNPNLGFINIDTTGKLVTVVGDVDTKSVGLKSTTRPTWEMRRDGTFATFDVTRTDDDGTAGLGAATADTFTATAYADPVAYITGATLADSRDVYVLNGAAAPTFVWDTVSAVAPPVGGSNAIVVSLKATGSAGGWTVKVYASDPALPPTFVDVTASLTPAGGAVPTALTAYTYGAVLSKASSGGTLRTVYIKADLLNAGVVADTRVVSVSYYA